jgi:hypothetical protein
VFFAAIDWDEALEMSDDIEIIVDDVNDIEARVYARYRGPTMSSGSEVGGITLHGTLRGPYCEKSRTLPAEFAFRDSVHSNEALAVVPDPCIWSPELPHLYRADVVARRGDQVIAEYRGTIGLRRSRSA